MGRKRDRIKAKGLTIYCQYRNKRLVLSGNFIDSESYAFSVYCGGHWEKTISSVGVRLKTIVWFIEKVPVCDTRESGVLHVENLLPPIFLLSTNNNSPLRIFTSLVSVSPSHTDTHTLFFPLSFSSSASVADFVKYLFLLQAFLFIAVCLK